MSGYPTAADHPNMSGGYIPTLYAQMLLVEFYKATVFGDIATTEYEGELKKFGDTLRIRALPEIEVRDYVKGQDLDYDTPDGGFVDLVINQGKYWAMNFNALDKKQIDIDYVQKWAQHASRNQQIAIDSSILSSVYADVDAANRGATAGAVSGDIDLGTTGTPVALTRSNIVEWIVENAALTLDEQDIHEDERYMVLPSWACAMLKVSDLKDASITGDGQSTLRNGRIGMIDRFTIYRSNNLSTVTDGADKVTNALFGHKCGIAFASQMMETETLKNPKDFGDLMRSLQAYGFEVIKPEAVGHGYITKG